MDIWLIRDRSSNRHCRQLCGLFRKAAHRCTSDCSIGSDAHRMLAHRAWKIVPVRDCRRHRYKSFALQLERLSRNGDRVRTLPVPVNYSPDAVPSGGHGGSMLRFWVYGDNQRAGHQNLLGFSEEAIRLG